VVATIVKPERPAPNLPRHGTHVVCLRSCGVEISRFRCPTSEGPPRRTDIRGKFVTRALTCLRRVGAGFAALIERWRRDVSDTDPPVKVLVEDDTVGVVGVGG
jgi:hypothetical protein